MNKGDKFPRMNKHLYLERSKSLVSSSFTIQKASFQVEGLSTKSNE